MPKPKDAPLTAKVVKGKLIISIGIDIAAFAAQQLEDFTPYDPEVDDWIKKYPIKNNLAFAKDTIRVMLREEEDGSSPLTNFLDKMFVAVLDDGSESIDYGDD